MSALTIRPARRGDIAALVHLLRRSWLVTWAPELPFAAVQNFAAYDPVPSAVQERWSAMWIGLVDETLVGVVDVDADRLKSLEVDPRMWDRKIGTQLLVHGERQIALSHPVAHLDVRAFNRRAIRFYIEREWTEVRRYPGTECGETVETIEMRKTL